MPTAYPPLSSYAVIGDTTTLALIDGHGSIDWLCLPDIDDGSIFNRILDQHRGGFFSVYSPNAQSVSRTYRDHTAVLDTRYHTEDGILTVTDAMAIPERSDLGPERMLVRCIRAESGRPKIRFRFSPRPEHGARTASLRERGNGVWSWQSGKEALVLLSDIPGQVGHDGSVEGEADLDAGTEHSLRLAYSARDMLALPGTEAAVASVGRTESYWREFAGKCRYDGAYIDQVSRSATMIRLLTFSLSGAILAAGTTSLPEASGAGRNWDYRYCWLRDASFLIRAYLGLGHHAEAKAFFTWIMHATRLSAPDLHPCYSVYGRTDIPERISGDLEGYRSSAPVRFGNNAVDQRQLDVYGSVISAALAFVEAGGTLERSEQRRVRSFAEVVKTRWTLPDRGIWEMRGPPRHYTYSKAMCWSALDCYGKLVRRGAISDDPDPFEKEAEVIRQAVLRDGWNEEVGAFTGAFGADFLDASLLLLPRFGLVPAADGRMVATREAIFRTLGEGCHLRRYAHGVDGLSSEEGTFWACGFWGVECLARAGDMREARRRFEALLADIPPLGILSEERDPASGDLRGNLPQAFSHAALINAALAIEAEDPRR